MPHTDNDIEKLLRYGKYITLECKLDEEALPSAEGAMKSRRYGNPAI